MRRLAALAVLVLAGCGASDEYAGLNHDAALEIAMTTAFEQVRADGPLHNHRFELAEMTQGSNGTGEDAWVARFQDTTAGEPFCVRVRLESVGLGTTRQVEIDGCRGEAPAETQTQPPEETNPGQASYSSRSRYPTPQTFIT
jgi:hypothetical protein